MNVNLPLSQRPQSFHPSFNKEVKMVVFMVETQGFKVDAVRLAGHSEFLQNMLFDEDGLIGSTQEGTEDHPIIVEGCTAQAFANFLLWLDHRPWAPLVATHLGQLLDILHISHMWDIQPGVAFASDQIQDDRFVISAAYSLDLARRYGLTHWVDKAVRTLLATPFYNYSDADRQYLGFDLYTIIAAAKDKISTERKRVARYVPVPNVNDGPFCPPDDHKTCVRIWIERWYMDVARQINGPVDPLPLSDIPNVLEASEHRGMKPDCKDYAVSWFRTSYGGHIQKEEDLIRETVDHICTLFV